MFYSVANIVFFTFVGSCNLLPAIHRGQLPLRECVVAGVCAHGATNLFCRGHCPLSEVSVVRGVAHGELQE